MDGPARAALALPALGAALAAAAMLQGGFYLAQLILVAAICVVGIVVSAVRSPLPREVWAGFAALFVGLAVSAGINGFTAEAFKPFLTLVVAVACTELAARAIVADGRHAVFTLVTTLAAAVAIAGIAGVAWHIDPLAVDADPWRLQSTLTYQNAAASLLALAVVPAAMLAMRGRVLARAAFAVILIALTATLSRGGYLAAAAAAAAFIVGARPSLRPLARPVLGALVGIAASAPAILGWPFGWLVATLGIAASIAIASTGGRARTPRRVLVAAAAVITVGLIAVVPATALRGRVTVSPMDRDRVWRQTVDRLGDHLLVGTGPGTYELIAPKGREIVRTEFAHNEYLQAASETGLVGLASITVALGLFAAAAWRRTRSISQDAWVASIASCLGFAAHSAVDFLWRIPVLVGVAFALYACAVVVDREADLGES